MGVKKNSTPIEIGYNDLVEIIS